MELIYMDVRARAESIRMVLHHGNVPFTDTTIPWDQMATYKQASPSGQFPTLVLEDKTTTFVESGAILRYAGRVAGLYPDEPVVQLQQDQVIEIVQDLSDCNPLLNYHDREEPGFQGKYDDFFGKAEPKLKLTESLLKGPYVSGDKPLVGDFHLWFLLDQAEIMKPGLLAGYPKLEAMFKKLLVDSKGLVKYLKARPKAADVGVPGMKNLGRTLSCNKYYKELEV